MCHCKLGAQYSVRQSEEEETNHIQIKWFYWTVIKPCIHSSLLHHARPSLTLFSLWAISVQSSLSRHMVAEHGHIIVFCAIMMTTEHRNANDAKYYYIVSNLHFDRFTWPHLEPLASCMIHLTDCCLKKAGNELPCCSHTLLLPSPLISCVAAPGGGDCDNRVWCLANIQNRKTLIC